MHELLFFFSGISIGATLMLIICDWKLVKPFRELAENGSKGWGESVMAYSQLLLKYNELRLKLEDLPQKSPIQRI